MKLGNTQSNGVDGFEHQVPHSASRFTAGAQMPYLDPEEFRCVRRLLPTGALAGGHRRKAEGDGERRNLPERFRRLAPFCFRFR